MTVFSCDCGDHNFKVVQYIWVVLVSPEDTHLLVTAKVRKACGYLTVQRRPLIGRGKSGKRVYLNVPRQILDVPQGMVPDHKNRNSLDNRRSNLRVATRSQNAVNSKNRKRPSGLPRGVNFSGKKFSAKIRVDGVDIALGQFVTAEAAGEAYVKARQQYCGEFAPDMASISRLSHLSHISSPNGVGGRA